MQTRFCCFKLIMCYIKYYINRKSMSKCNIDKTNLMMIAEFFYVFHSISDPITQELVLCFTLEMMHLTIKTGK